MTPDVADGKVDDPRGPVHQDDAHRDDGDGQALDDAVEDDLRVDPADGQHHAGTSPPKNTARARSSRSMRSAIGPSKRTWPFSMKTARSAMAAATLRDCSTMIMVTPSALSRSITSISSCTTIGARPERELVDHQHLRVVQERDGQGQHLLLATRQRVGPAPLAYPRSAGNRPRTRSIRRRSRPGHPGRRSRPSPGSPSIGHLPEDAPAAGQEMDAESASAARGWRRSTVRPLSRTTPRSAVAEPGRDAQRGRLAGAVGPEQGQHLALVAPRSRPRRAPGRARS